jgi:succinate dehydrogenase / fumarate reductase flavoprotein subunit
VPFAHDDGKILQRAFGGMTMDFGKAAGAHLRRRGPHWPCMLHTMYGQALRHSAEFFIDISPST